MNEITADHTSMLKKGTRLNFQVFHTLEIDSRNLEFIHLISSAVLSGHMDNVSFYNASFLSTKFSNVAFEKCNLKSTDMCSIWANKCRFIDCDFSDATISDSTFINCEFSNPILESVSLTRCQFIDCKFEQLSTDDSTISLNTFTRCQIHGAKFEESFYYQIFEDCELDCVDMVPELLGYNFGFSPVLFSKLSEGIELEAMNTSFIANGLYINAAILRINQLQKCYDEAMIACVAAIGQMIQQDILIKADEIDFLKNLVTFFQRNQKIAPISVLRIWQMLTNYFMDQSPNISASKAMPHIQEFANMLYFDYMDFQKKLQERLMQLPQPESVIDTAELQIVYLEEPDVPLLNCLMELSSFAGPACPEPYLIRTEKGSFHDFHEIAVIAIPYIQTLLSLLGVAAQIIIYKMQKQDQKQADLVQKDVSVAEKHEIEITLPVSAMSQLPILIPNITSITPETNAILTNVLKASSTQILVANAGFCGYNTNNIQSITIRIH